MCVGTQLMLQDTRRSLDFKRQGEVTDFETEHCSHTLVFSQISKTAKPTQRHGTQHSKLNATRQRRRPIRGGTTPYRTTSGAPYHTSGAPHRATTPHLRLVKQDARVELHQQQPRVECGAPSLVREDVVPALGQAVR